jgi:hypothetical protein
MLTERPSLVGEINANFADRGCHVVRAKVPYGRILGFLDRSRYCFFPSSASIVLTRLSGPQFQTYYFSENLVVPQIEPGPLGL